MDKEKVKALAVNIVIYCREEKFTEDEKRLLPKVISDVLDQMAKRPKKCPHCGADVFQEDNFCGHCGNKISESCFYCWMNGKDSYNCGESSCPGFNYHRLEKLKA